MADTDLNEASAARVLGISERTLRRYRRGGHIGHLRSPGGRVRYTLADLIAFRTSTHVSVAEQPE